MMAIAISTMTPYEVLVVINAICIGTYVTNALLDVRVNQYTDFDCHVLQPTQSTKHATIPAVISRLLLSTIRKCGIKHAATDTKPTSRGFLTSVPPRQPASISPKAFGPAPGQILEQLFISLAEGYPDYVYLIPERPRSCPLTLSSLGEEGFRLYARSRSRTRPPSTANNNHNTLYHGEIAHIENANLHIILHPADAAILVNCGWARPFSANNQVIPQRYIVVPPPTSTKEEEETTTDVLKAAIWYARGRRCSDDLSILEEEGLLTRTPSTGEL